LSAGGRIDFVFNDSAAAADAKRWDISVDGVGGPNSFSLVTRNDAGAAGDQALQAIRSANALTSLTLMGNRATFSTTVFSPVNAGGLTLGASAARWGKLWGQDADFSLDVKMDVLGTFDHTGTRFSTGAGPVADDIMSWHGSAGKWRPRFLQTQFTSGAAVSQNNTDGTFATFFNSNPSLSGAPSNPSVAPVVTAMYKSTLIDMSAYVLGGTQVYVLDYSVNGGGYTTDRIITTSAKVIHSSLDPTKTYAYKYKIRGGSDSSYSPASSAINPSTATEANAFGLIVASQIATAYLSSINANIGSITAGQLISGDGKSLLQLDSSFSVPGAVTQGIFFASANPVPGTVTGMYIDFTATTTNPLLHHSKFDLLADGSAILKGVVRDTDSKFVIDVAGTTARLITIIDEQGSPKTRVKIGEVNTGASDWGLQVFDSAGATIVDMTAANLLIQDSAVKFKADFTNALITVTDAQGSPIVRSKFGKISAATDDYGLQVWDKLGDTVIDLTGAKRILAIPVQPSTDSGTAITVDLSTGLTQQVRLTGTATVTFTNPTNGGRYRIWFQQDTTGSRPFPTIVGPNGEVVMYTNDTPPTLTTTPGTLDLFEFEYRTNPTTRFTCMTLQTNVLLPTPQVQSMTPTSVSSASTTHNVSMPATVNAGDLLLMLITFHATQGSVTTPSGWTAAGSIGLANIFTKAASGSEGGTTVNVVTANSVKAAAQTYRITRWFGDAGTNGVVVATNSGAPGTSADPSNNTPNWTDRTLWLAAAAVTGNPTFSVDPTNYTNVQSTGDGASTCLLRSLRRTLYATSENPSTFTWSGSQSWSAFTIAVRPPA
jgi:hypothetical protein